MKLRRFLRSLAHAFKAPPIPPDPDERRRDLPRSVPPGTYDRFGRRLLTKRDLHERYLRIRGYDFSKFK